MPQIGFIGLGRMGANMVRRLTAAGISCVVFDANADAVKALQIPASPALIRWKNSCRP